MRLPRAASALTAGWRRSSLIVPEGGRALLTEPNILILDEPTSALDLKNLTVVLDWISRLTHDDGLTVVFTTHHPHHALVVDDDAMLMLDETNFVCGQVDMVLNEENLYHLFGVPIIRMAIETHWLLRRFRPSFSNERLIDLHAVSTWALNRSSAGAIESFSLSRSSATS